MRGGGAYGEYREEKEEVEEGKEERNRERMRACCLLCAFQRTVATRARVRPSACLCEIQPQKLLTRRETDLKYPSASV